MKLSFSAYFWILLFQLGWDKSSGVRWLSLALSSVNTDKPTACEQMVGLVKRQRKVCRRNLDLMPSVQSGAKVAIRECQEQFKNRRWNCSTVNAKSIFGNVLNQGTREAAFVHSISSAAVAHAVTRACSSGSLERCGCDPNVRERYPVTDFEWAGCSDNIAFGSTFSRKFVDARERGKGKNNRSNRAIMNIHNNRAGRKAVEYNMKTRCKCHGVSGSCELRTCWRAMPSFSEIGKILKEKFDGATEVQEGKKHNRKILAPISPGYKPHTETDLVYLVASPDFCEPDVKTGSLGTQGRKCNKTSKGIDGCDLMCCGRGFTTQTKIVIDRCNCKFYWCCVVKCKKCRKEVQEHTCL